MGTEAVVQKGCVGTKQVEVEAGEHTHPKKGFWADCPDSLSASIEQT